MESAIAQSPPLQRLRVEVMQQIAKEPPNHLVVVSDTKKFLQLLGIESEQYCRFIARLKPECGLGDWKCLGECSGTRPQTSLSDYSEDARRFVLTRHDRCDNVDVYITPNEFFSWRCTAQLALLHANWVEIDTKGHTILGKNEENEILREALQQLLSQGIPLPTAAVRSGSGGIHLYWIYNEAVDAYPWRVEIWRQIAKRLSDLKGGTYWKPDFGASHDPARVMRLVGSIHGKSGRDVSVEILNETISFEALAASIGLSTVKKLGAKKTKHTTSEIEPESQSKKTHGKHTIGQWWSKIYFNILSQVRRKGKLQEGTRDLTAFILFTALQHLTDEPTSLERIHQINDELIGLERHQLDNYLSTAQQVRYKFKKDTLARLIEDAELDSSFLFTNTEQKLSKEQIKRKQSESAKRTAEIKSIKSLDKLIFCLKTLENPSKQDVAEHSGLSISTVRRLWSKANDVISSASIYSAPRKGIGDSDPVFYKNGLGSDDEFRNEVRAVIVNEKERIETNDDGDGDEYVVLEEVMASNEDNCQIGNFPSFHVDVNTGELFPLKKLRVGFDSHVTFGKRMYSVPCIYVGCWVWLCISDFVISIHDFESKLIITQHQRSYVPGYSTVEEHVENVLREGRASLIKERLVRKATTIGPNVRSLVDSMFISRKFEVQALRAVMGVISLHKRYDNKDFDEGCRLANERGWYRYGKVIRAIEEVLNRSRPSNIVLL